MFPKGKVLKEKSIFDKGFFLLLLLSDPMLCIQKGQLFFLGKPSVLQVCVSLVEKKKITFTHQLQHGNEFCDR